MTEPRITEDSPVYSGKSRLARETRLTELTDVGADHTNNTGEDRKAIIDRQTGEIKWWSENQ